MSILIDDEEMDDYSSGNESSGYNTDVINSDDEVEQPFGSATLTKANSSLGFDITNPFNLKGEFFSIGNDNIAPAPPFKRPHADSSDRVLKVKRLKSNERIRSLSQSSGAIVPNAMKRSSYNLSSTLASLKPPTPIQKRSSGEPEYNFSIPSFNIEDSDDPPSPYKPPTTCFNTKLRSRSMVTVNRNTSLSDDEEFEPLITPPPLEESSKENIVNSIPSSSSFQFSKPNSAREEAPCRIGQVRRTMSMVSKPSPPMFDTNVHQRRSTGQNLLRYPPKLPTTARKESCEFISTSTVVDLMEGKFDADFDNYVIVDCRYTYEFDGGHIPNAISILPAEREKRLLEEFMTNPSNNSRFAIIFHCEFSSKRGPATCRRLRELDREAHGLNFDDLFYPYLYVMEGGYQNFYRDFPNVCNGTYIEMKDKRFKAELTKNKKLEKVNEKVRRSNSAVVSRRRGNALSRSHQSLSFSQGV